MRFTRSLPFFLPCLALVFSGASCVHPTPASPAPEELPSTTSPSDEETVAETPAALPTPPSETISRLPRALPRPAEGTIPQFVLLAFDGSQSTDMWKETRDFAAAQKTNGTSIHFSYFINASFLLTPATKNTYLPPHHPPGTSPIKFGWSKKDVADRIEQINLAAAEGHEIGSHSVGHWNGSTWTEADWNSELTQFADITRAAGLPKSAGFRAPELGISAGLWPALKALGYRYDTSRVSRPDLWPSKNAQGLWEFPLAFVPYNGTEKKIVAMDYNFYFKQTAAEDTLKKGTPEWQAAHDAVLKTYTDYFDANYATSRAPVQIGHHFSLWNDRVYWDAMKDFAARECSKPDVRCVTFSELADWLDAHPNIVTLANEKSPVR